MAKTSLDAEIVQTISDELRGTRAGLDIVQAIQARLRVFHEEYVVLTGDNATADRDRLRELAGALHAAALAVARGPDELEDIIRAETGAGSTNLANMLQIISERAGRVAENIALPSARNVNANKLSAWYAFLLMQEFSNQRPTTTPSGPFFTIAFLVSELFTGETESRLSHACRAVLDGEFPRQPSRIVSA